MVRPTRAGATDPGPPVGGLVDADVFLAVTARLRDVHARLDRAPLDAGRRARLQRRLAEIADAATCSLEGVAARLDELEASLPASDRE